jgi:hypothetical protein
MSLNQKHELSLKRQLTMKYYCIPSTGTHYKLKNKVQSLVSKSSIYLARLGQAGVDLSKTGIKKAWLYLIVCEQ